MPFVLCPSELHTKNDKIKMQVPVELKIKYLNRRIDDLEKLHRSLEADDYSLALKLGHQVKGNADTFEFPQMAHLGIEIEQAARNQDKEAVRMLAAKMETAIQNAQSMFMSAFPIQ